ncbi:MAG: hypothetical protein GY760_06330 [Deltaproteobacteria bacterium]|nr:hypothetical protein [Deltaproteobacteria bacterium]
MTKLLIDNGADVNVKNKKGLTPVFNTFYTLTNMKYLVQAGANVNAVTNDGLNTIHYAVLLNDIKGAEFLIQNGADPLFKTTKGSIWFLPVLRGKTINIPKNTSPFTLAKLFGNREKIMELLKKYTK